MSEHNVEVVRRTLEIFAREGTNPSYEGLVANDVELRPAFEVAGDASYIGPEGVARFMRQWTEDFDDWALRVDDLRDAGEAVVARVRQSARGKGSGAPVELLFGIVFRVRDGQIARMEMYMSVAEALKAVGLTG
jgi:ketosteroid isomerase-like protein